VQTLAQHLHAPSVSAERCLADLIKRRWVQKHQDGWHLGESDKWFVDSPPGKPTRVGEHSAIDKVRRIAREGAAHIKDRETKPKEISTDLKESILGDLLKVNPKDVDSIKKIFQHNYEVVFGCSPAPPSGVDERSQKAQKTEYIRRGLRHLGGKDEFGRIIKFIFENWEDIRSSRVVSLSRPAWKLLGNKTFLKQIQLAEIHGFGYFSDYGVRDIHRHFLERHKDIWGYPPVALSSGVATKQKAAEVALVSRGFNGIGKDGARLMRIIDFLFDNWVKLKEKHKWGHKSPGWPMFGSNKLLLFLEREMDET